MSGGAPATPSEIVTFLAGGAFPTTLLCGWMDAAMRYFGGVPPPDRRTYTGTRWDPAQKR